MALGFGSTMLKGGLAFLSLELFDSSQQCGFPTATGCDDRLCQSTRRVLLRLRLHLFGNLIYTTAGSISAWFETVGTAPPPRRGRRADKAAGTAALRQHIHRSTRCRTSPSTNLLIRSRRLPRSLVQPRPNRCCPPAVATCCLLCRHQRHNYYRLAALRLVFVVALALVVVADSLFLQQQQSPPRSTSSLGERRQSRSAVLLALPWSGRWTPSKPSLPKIKNCVFLTGKSASPRSVWWHFGGGSDIV